LLQRVAWPAAGESAKAGARYRSQKGARLATYPFNVLAPDLGSNQGPSGATRRFVQWTSVVHG
jgi:hypothetical protein